MKSKKEILDKKVCKWSEIDEDSVFEAMDECAKEVAMGFAEWIPHNAVIAEDDYHYISLKNDLPITASSLFTLYLEELNKK